jgi:hypothetical protein
MLMSSDATASRGTGAATGGHYSNPGYDTINNRFPGNDAAKLKKQYTQAVKIYCDRLPSFC